MFFIYQLVKNGLVLKITLFILNLLASIVLNAQVKTDSDLFLALKKNDSLLFESAFNKCNHADILEIIDTDLEFYHDQGGITNGKQTFLETLKNNICSNPKSKPIRKLVANSLEVHPLYNNGELYGAIQKGKHDFYLRESGKLRPTVTADFTHLWIKKNNKWMLTRVLSYNHHPIQH